MQTATCHLLAVLFLTLGPEAQSAYDTLLPLLQVRCYARMLSRVCPAVPVPTRVNSHRELYKGMPLGICTDHFVAGARSLKSQSSSNWSVARYIPERLGAYSIQSGTLPVIGMSLKLFHLDTEIRARTSEFLYL